VFSISSGSVVMSPVSFLILLIRMLSLCSLVRLAKSFIYVVDFLKEPAHGLVDSLYSSFCFYLVDFSHEFDYFLQVYSSGVNLLPFILELLGILSSC
jgi:hypothetical protein